MSRVKKHRVVIQCVTRTRAEWRGVTVAAGMVEAEVGTQLGNGTCADPDLAILWLLLMSGRAFSGFGHSTTLQGLREIHVGGRRRMLRRIILPVSQEAPGWRRR